MLPLREFALRIDELEKRIAREFGEFTDVDINYYDGGEEVVVNADWSKAATSLVSIINGVEIYTNEPDYIDAEKLIDVIKRIYIPERDKIFFDIAGLLTKEAMGV